MFTKTAVERVAERHQEWDKLLAKSLAKAPERLERFSTISDEEIKNIYTPEDVSELIMRRISVFLVSFPIPVEFRRACTAVVSGRCVSLREWVGLKRPMTVFTILWVMVRPV